MAKCTTGPSTNQAAYTVHRQRVLSLTPEPSTFKKSYRKDQLSMSSVGAQRDRMGAECGGAQRDPREPELMSSRKLDRKILFGKGS